MGKGKTRTDASGVDAQIEKLTALRDEIRGATREAHEVLGDIRRETKGYVDDVRAVIDERTTAIVKDAAEKVYDKLISELDKVHRHTQERVHAYVDGTEAHLDRLGTLCDGKGDIAAMLAVRILLTYGTVMVDGEDRCFHLIEQVGAPSPYKTVALRMPKHHSTEEIRQRMNEWIAAKYASHGLAVADIAHNELYVGDAP